MFEAYFQGFSQLLIPANILFLCFGILLGIIVGILPGIGGLVGISLFMPLLWVLEPARAILILLGLYSTCMTGGTIPAVLMGIPGSPSNIASIIDGYPMTQRGEGARAMGAALTSSALGSIISVVFALLMIPIIFPVVLALRSPEMALLMVVGLCFLAVLGGGEDNFKNLMSGMFGILIALIGFQSTTGVLRYTFGSPHLFDGLSLVVVALGIFAMSEIMDIYLKGKAAVSAAETTKLKLSDTLQGAKDVFRNWWLWLRCSIIGFIIGVIPGIGGSIAIFIAYGYGNKVSKHPEQWGKGCVEGVIAPESANNASIGGSTLTTLAFGIPGDSVMALVLGAIMIIGIVPGREMLTENLDMVFMLLGGLALANILAVFFILPFISHLAKITTTPYKFLFCVLLALITASTFTSSRLIMDIWMLIPLGIIGVCMKRCGFSMACFILGFVLAPLFEHYLWLSLMMQGRLFFISSPITIIFVLILVGLFSYSPIKTVLSKAFGKQSSVFAENSSIDQRNDNARTAVDRLHHIQSKPVSYFLGFLIIMAVVFLLQSLTFGPLEAKVTGIFASTVMIVLGILQLIKETGKPPETEEQLQKKGEIAIFLRKAGTLALWIGGFTLAIYLLGFLISVPVFIFSYLKSRHTGWVVSIIPALATTAIIYGLFEAFLLRPLWKGLIPVISWLMPFL
jgi:putative tricarboxylic transport membrane protein